MLDPATLGLCARLGVSAGRRCLEVGARTLTVATALARAVGPTGSVTATVVCPVHPVASLPRQLRVVRHDLTGHCLPEGAWQLLHARCAVEDRGAPGAVVHRMAQALAPGGWLVAEELDLRPRTLDAAAARIGGEARAAFRRYLTFARACTLEIDAQPDFSVLLPTAFRDAGLVNVAARTRSPLSPGGATSLYALSLRQLMPALVERRIATERECTETLDVLSDSGLSFPAPPVVAAWGQRLPAPRSASVTA